MITGPVGNPSGPWELAFADEFNVAFETPYGTGPNPNVWTDHFEGGDMGRTNNTSEQEWYPHGYYNHSVSGSVLTLTAKNENPQSVDPTCPNPLQSGGPTGTFTSAMASGHLGISFTYGFIEARIQQPSPSSSWPAFWMLTRGDTWPPEIDIEEWQPPGHSGQDQLGYFNMASTWQSTYRSGDESYHVWGCLLTSSTVAYYLDGVEVTSHTYDGNAFPWYPILNYAIEGASGGSGYPAQYNVDYVRAWVPAGAPAAPVITSISPSTGLASGGDVAVNFDTVAGAASYRVWASPTDSVADNFPNNSNVKYSATGTASPITVTGLPSGVRFNFSVCGINATGYSQESAVAGPQIIEIQLTTTALPGATEGTAYSATLSAQAGNPPYTWSISAGSLPAGLSLNSSTGVISGTPTANGTSSFTAEVTGASGWSGATTVANSATRALSITVGAAGTSSTGGGGGSTSGGSGWTLVASENFTTDDLSANFVVYNNSTATSYSANSWMASQVSIDTSTQELILNAALSGGAGSERVGGALYWTGTNNAAIMKYGAWECDYSTENQAGYAPVMLMWPYPDNSAWPTDGEIDIIEIYTGDTKTSCGQTNLHLDTVVGSSRHLTEPASGNYDLDFTVKHTVRLEWQPTYIAVYVDGTQLCYVTDTSYIPTQESMRWTMQQEFYGVSDGSISSLNADTIITGLRAYTFTGSAATTQPMSSLVDTFSSNDLAALWGNSANATWSTGQVSIPVNTSASGKLGSTNAYNLTGSSLAAEITPANGAAYSTDLTLSAGTSYIKMGCEGGNLVANLTQASADSFDGSIAYNATSHKYWRIREASGTIYWDTSPDGSTWTNRWSTAYTMAVTALTVDFTASSTTGSSTSTIIAVN